MTSAERAKAFVEEHRGFDLDGNCWFIACDRAEANLVRLITQAQNDKLEEAAAHFERYSAAFSGRSFAATLRALKSKD